MAALSFDHSTQTTSTGSGWRALPAAIRALADWSRQRIHEHRILSTYDSIPAGAMKDLGFPGAEHVNEG
ncbi:MAG: hypothetical protein RLZZ444_3318 [Pseudomonadota bacterium]|jgi:hypothetical protein